jgi:hypothetical protein
VGKHSPNGSPQELVVQSGIVATPRRVRQPLPLRIFAFTVAAGVILVAAIAPMPRESALAETAALAQGSGQTGAEAAVQELAVSGDHAVPAIARSSYQVVKPVMIAPPAAAAKAAGRQAPAAGMPDPGSAKAVAHGQVMARGWGEGEYNCLVSLWQKESNWNVYAFNKSSGAYGIPQSLPGSKMASVGADWETNPATQITWGLNYISGRYSTPCGAWNASLAKGWY